MWLGMVKQRRDGEEFYAKGGLADLCMWREGN